MMRLVRIEDAVALVVVEEYNDGEDCYYVETLRTIPAVQVPAGTQNGDEFEPLPTQMFL